MQRDDPIGIMKGTEWYISKWRNMTAKEHSELHGRIEGDKRNGPITVTIYNYEKKESEECKSVADLKRKLQIWSVLHRTYSLVWKPLEIDYVEKIQTNAIKLKSGSWIYYNDANLWKVDVVNGQIWIQDKKDSHIISMFNIITF